ncbi:8-amino-7-oxononanoate synthase [Paenibacillus sp. UMB4589-SE434]|uniref:aminotransferase class I/II-fold pyridoxal phosphate-dependent enzyme n=1 Tax=Paenibacillus sp. UMB4589-SE434 TaxID=3046314 RepID=UPI00254ED38E|nr:8-amino-7-oxononanoate synthase [Paenibacillus sp. UMB4589-SE434]MDK8182701.1 8-amino-7-oxononanoate synthase [Paenibacillus sp. UMB4589-SE434]
MRTIDCFYAARQERYAWMQEELDDWDNGSRMRVLQVTRWLENGWMEREGKRLFNLASNHYLGLCPWLDEATLMNVKTDCFAAGEAGVRIGSGASRLVVGHDPLHAELEQDMANFKQRDRCLVFSSGYMANVGVISALVGRHDTVFSDRLNHASLIDGAVLSRAEHIRYPHRDMNRLEHSLRKWSGDRATRHKGLIVTDGIFSMDGTVAPLEDLVVLAERYGTMLMVDEAHSGGVYGFGGRGLCHAVGVHQRVDVVMGTFGKAFGAFGAYVAADEVLIRYLVNRARTLVYSTGLPPLMAAIVRRRLREVQAADEARDRLVRHAALFRARLRAGGLHTGAGDSHIVPVLLGSDRRAVAAGQALAEAGVAGIAIRPPTVPEGSARIRFAPMASHQESDLIWAADQIVQVVGSLKEDATDESNETMFQ